MSQTVREWLILLQLFDQTTHEDRLERDKEIERRTARAHYYTIPKTYLM